MAINKITLKNGILHEEAVISFTKGRLASIVGLNGHGKSKLLESLQKKTNHSNVFNNLPKNIAIEYGISEEDKKELQERFKTDLPVKATYNTDDNFEKQYESVVDSCYAGWYKILDKMCRAKGKKISWDKNPENKTFVLIHSLIQQSKEIDEFSQEFYNWKNKIVAFIDALRSKIKTKYIEQTSSINTNFKVHFNEMGSINPLSTLQANGKLITLLSRKVKLSVPNHATSQEEKVAFLNAISQEFSKYFNSQDIKISFNMASSSSSYTDFRMEYLDNGQKRSFDELSAGTRSFIRIVLHSISVDEYTCLLIDEPESGLHPAFQKDLRDFLENLIDDTNCRIVITTHSEYMLNKFSNHVNTYVSWKENDNKFLFDNITEYHKASGDYGNIQIWEELGISANNQFNDINENSKVILVEGISDVLYFKKFLAMNKVNLGSWKMIAGNGDGNIKYKFTYLKDVKGLKPKNTLMIFDGDVKEKFDSWLKKEKVNFIKLPVDTIEYVLTEQEQKAIQFNKNTKINEKINCAMKFAVRNNQLSSKTKKTIKGITDQINTIINKNTQ